MRLFHVIRRLLVDAEDLRFEPCQLFAKRIELVEGYMIWLVKVGTYRPGYVPQSLNQLLRHIHARKTEFGENHLTERKSDRKL